MIPNYCKCLRVGMTFLALIAVTTVLAQTKFTGLITDTTGKPVANVNVLLLSARDSSFVKGAISRQNGEYVLENIPAGAYFIKASYSGFVSVYSDPVEVNGKEERSLGSLSLSEPTGKLQGVTVSAKKPLFEQKLDRMVINVQSSITSAGNNALEILERSPGVNVDRQNNSVSVSGKSGVVIMINGKISQMPASAVVQMLSGINAASVERIEVITTPPANFDAEGNAGFINIVLKANPEAGTNGNFGVTAGYGTGPVGATDASVNYRKGKINLFSSYAFSYTDFTQEIIFHRSVNYQSVINETNTVTDRLPVQRNHNLRAGMDYQPGKNTIIGFLVAGYNNKWSMDAQNYSYVMLNGVKDSSVSIRNHEVNQWRHYMANLNLLHTFKKGQKLSVDADYVYYHDHNPNTYSNSFINKNGTKIRDEETKSGKRTPIRVLVMKADYSFRLKARTEIETGIKAATSNFINDVRIDRLEGLEWKADPEFTSKSELNEEIFAGYVVATMVPNDRTSIKGGLRYEYTLSNLGTELQPDIIDRKYGRLFPSVFISQKLSRESVLNFSYSRRITRPSFDQMAPFTIFFDPNTFFSGNTALQPSIANAIKGVYSYKKYFVSLEYTHIDNTITRFTPYVDSVTNKQFFYPENLDYTQLMTAIISIPLTVNNWWTIQNSITGIWQQNNGTYNKMNLRIEQKIFRINSSHTISLPRNFSFQATGFYQSKGFFGFSILKPLGSLDLGLRKKLDNNKGSFSLTVSDLFNTNVWRTFVDLPEYNLVTSFRLQFYPRTYRLTYTRSFGNNELKSTRKRETGSEEERRRVN